MYSRRIGFILILLVAVAFALSASFYSRIPESVASHWNASGEVDGYTSRAWGVLLMPSMLVFMLLIFTIVPKLHPLKLNAPSPSGPVGAFMVGMFLFFNLIHLQILLWNTGTQVPFSVTIPLGIGGIFFMAGIMLGSVEPNWLVGIRT